jgi:hypothetical protein
MSATAVKIWEVNLNFKRRLDIQHNDTQHNDIQRNNKLNTTLSIITLSIMVECCYAKCQLC